MKYFANKILPISLSVLLVVTASFFWLNIPTAEAGFSFYRSVTVNTGQVPSTQSAFPMLVSGTYSYLATTGNGGKVQNANGYDVGFYSNSDCSTGKLNWETELYTATTGKVVYWINISSISDGTVIYMCYGDATISTDQSNKTAVWDSNYKGVYHLPDGSSLTANDSTASPANGTLTNTPTPTTGQIDGGMSTVAASSQFVDMGNVSKLDIGAVDFTLSYWFNAPNASQFGSVVSKRVSGSPFIQYHSGIGLLNGGGSAVVGKGVYFAGIASGIVIQSYHTNNNYADGAWHYVTVTRTSGTVAIYVDGTSQTLTADAANTTSLNFTNTGPGQLANSNGLGPYDGKSDEVRISTSLSRSANWITTEYNNQSAPATFYAVGAEQSSGGATPFPHAQAILLKAQTIINNGQIIIN